MATRTYLHVGTPKSGTSFVHGVLWQNVDALRDHGLLLPGRMTGHYAAARSVLADDEPLPAPSQRPSNLARPCPAAAAQPDSHGRCLNTAGHDCPWSRLVRHTNAWDGQAFIGHPQLAAATSEQAARAKSHVNGEVELVITARALHLQPAASWQEQVKSGQALTYDVFVNRLRDDRGKGRRFWRVHDIAAVAERWRGRESSDRVKVIPVQPLSRNGSEPADLWSRYAAALGLDPTAFDSAVAVTEHPLGPAEIELLRQVHARRDPRFVDAQRHVWTRQLLANGILARRPATPIRLPEHAEAWFTQRSATILAGVWKRGYHIAGELDVLAWSDPPPSSRLASEVTVDELDEVASWTILRLQEELVHREPTAPLPSVGPDDGVDAVLELLEHIRAADSGRHPRPAPNREVTRVARLRRAIPVRRPR